MGRKNSFKITEPKPRKAVFISDVNIPDLAAADHSQQFLQLLPVVIQATSYLFQDNRIL